MSARTQYACLAVMQLAGSYGTGEPVQLRTIAERHGIPARFLVQIFQQLKGAGLVSSTRGAAGGYRLIRPPTELTLAEVMRLIDGGSSEVKPSCTRETNQSKALLDVWNHIARREEQMLNETTFHDLLEAAASGVGNMYYI